MEDRVITHAQHRPGILRAGSEPYNSTQHETDHCENDETDVTTCEVLVVFGKSAAAAKPAVGALNDRAWVTPESPWRCLSG